MFSQAAFQFKRVGDAIHLSGPLRLMWNRISFSRLTLFYFCFSVLHFIIQLSFQIKAFTINANASSFLSRIVDAAQTTNDSLPFLDGNILRMCSWVPSNLNLDVESCPVIWNGTAVAAQANPSTNAVGNVQLPELLSSVGSIFSAIVTTTQASASTTSSVLYSSTPVSVSGSTGSTDYTSISSAVVSTSTGVSSVASTQSTSQPASPAVTITTHTTSRVFSTVIVTSPISSVASSTASISTVSQPSSTSSAGSSTTAKSSTTADPQTVTVFVPSKPTPSDDASPSDGTTRHHDHDQDDDEDDADDEDEDEDNANGLTGFSGFEDLKLVRRDVAIVATRNGNSVSVSLSGLSATPDTLENGCLWALNWPVSVLGNTKREDMVFIGFQVWVLGMSLVALLNESIPHIIASLATHMIATAWAAFQIVHTAHFRADFNRVITHGACRNVSLLPNYWDARAKAEIPSLALNVIALFISSFLTWKLIKLFGWQTFKRVGASLTINRIYKYVLFLSVTIQLSLFFMIVTVSLWIDQLMNSVIGDLASFQKLYKVTSLITLALLIPWLMTGWFAVRRELKVPMIIFMILSVLYLGGWSIMFISTTFRWTFVTWTFFSIMASTSVLLTIISAALGIICGLNFGKGLSRYLNAQQPLDEEDNTSFYTGDNFEKVDFPSSEKPLPTYASLDFNQGYKSYPGSVMGPRFSNKYAEPFETARTIAYPAPIVSRNVTDLQLQRSVSHGSTNSVGSSSSSNSTENSRPGQKRWVIE